MQLKRTLAFFALSLLIMPVIAAATPVHSEPSDEEGWWIDTTVDRNGNSIGDMVEKFHDHPLFLDEEGTLPVIVDYSRDVTEDDVRILEQNVDFEHQVTLQRIDAIAGRVPHNMILETLELPGVIMIELDGILEALNGDVAVVHAVDVAQQNTGYDGSGVTVAIIDTGIDGNHSGLDDQDDDPTTYDPKIIGFYDAVNNPSLTNGTEVFPYDDQGHGTHCAGTTAGTGAPTYEHPGMAPQANLVGVKVLDAGGSGSFATVMAGMQWTVDHRYEFNIRAASMSLGGPGAIEWTSSEEDSVNRYANEMVRAGVAMFIAAGNNGVSSQIGTPGSAEDVITVGALDKDTSIAIYSSQGPTEEGRIKPNIAFVGSDVMSAEANSGDGYVGFSGTSMATPGAAGVAALMYQANPDLSPFDIRNIMQETATYRQCHYMFANEPCADDLIPKNRQNNVYGHGHVNADVALQEAAEKSYEWDSNKTITIETPMGEDDRIHLMPGDSIEFDLSSGVDTIQWRSNHLRDDWANLHSYEMGEESFTLDDVTIYHQLEHLPGIEIEGNHTLSVRGITCNNAECSAPLSTPLVAVDIMMMDSDKMLVDGQGDESGAITGGTLIIIVLLIVIAALAAFIVQLRNENNDMILTAELERD
ncbi:MAG: S8 family peptidase [Candidatus Thermoplasmatota archaeon]|nr:S8 family peptidase [Candidatus Thermoplasmatota archaeon]